MSTSTQYLSSGPFERCSPVLHRNIPDVSHALTFQCRPCSQLAFFLFVCCFAAQSYLSSEKTLFAAFMFLNTPYLMHLQQRVEQTAWSGCSESCEKCSWLCQNASKLHRELCFKWLFADSDKLACTAWLIFLKKGFLLFFFFLLLSPTTLHS